MPDQPLADEPQKGSSPIEIGSTSGSTSAANSPSASAPVTSTAPDSAPAASLTPEEQMALFEKDLKENDWGHQPC